MSSDLDDDPPIAVAVHRRKKRTGLPGVWHWRVLDCPFCHRSHSAPALGLQLSECVGEPRIYRVAEVESEPADPVALRKE